MTAETRVSTASHTNSSGTFRVVHSLEDWIAVTGFAGRFHPEEVVSAPDGSRFRVRVQRTGVHRYSPVWNNLLDIAIGWARYLRRGRRTWSVTVNLTGIVRYEEVWDEVSPTVPLPRARPTSSRMRSAAAVHHGRCISDRKRHDQRC